MTHLLKKTCTAVCVCACMFALFAKGSKERMPVPEDSMTGHDPQTSFFSETRIKYPVFEDEPILNEFIYKTVEKTYAEFTAENKTEAGAKAALEFHIGYEDVYRSDEYISFLLDCYTYTGGAAHGLRTFIPVNYNVREKRLISLEDILPVPLDTGLALLSAESQKQLMAAMKKGTLSSNEETIKNGTAPVAENFKNVVIMKDAIEIIFEHYQVAPYSSGTLGVTIPLTVFKQ